MKSFAFVALLGLGAASAGSLRRCLRFNVPAFSSNLLLRPVVLAARVLFLVSTTPSLAVQAPDVETQAHWLQAARRVQGLHQRPPVRLVPD